MSAIPFNHAMAAHCESGSLSALLNHRGLRISEPMLFGVAAGIFFAYLKIPSMHFPVFAVRSRPGDLRRNIAKRLGIRFFTRRYRDPGKATAELEQLLERNIPVAVQTDMFYMDYIPEHLRTHFNAHFVVVFGKENGLFTISDCYYPSAAQIPEVSLEKARFAKGDFSPRGLLTYPLSVPDSTDWEGAIRKGIHQAARGMTRIPLPFVGVRGIRLFARKIPLWPGYARNSDQLSHEIMKINVLLEEQGTGGAGFRFMYATFLQEASKLLNKPAYADMSKRMMANGDKWRELSLYAARMGKNRDFAPPKFSELSELIMERADEEQTLFTELHEMTK
jgi:hypothetical protein